MKKINLKRANPKRSEKRKFVGDGKKLVSLRPRVPQELKYTLTQEAAKLGISESLYINAIIVTRDMKKIKNILEDK